MLRQVSLTMEGTTGVQEAARAHNASLRVLDCKDVSDDDMAFLIDVSKPGGNANDVIADLKSKKLFKRVYAGETGEQSSRSLCVAILERPGICQAVHDSGAFCLSCPYGESEDGGKWNFLVKDSEQLKTLLANLEEEGIKASVGGLSAVKQAEELTRRQTEILAKAISLGFFEFPRRVSLTQLSREIGVKPSTLSQILRAAEDKVMARYAIENKIIKVAAEPKGSFA